MFRFISIVFSAILLTAYTSSHAQKKELTFDDIFVKGTFMPKYVAGFNSMKDEQYYSAIRVEKKGIRNNIYISQYDIRTRQVKSDIVNVTEIIKSAAPNSELDDYVFNNDESKILLLFNGENIYRRSVMYNTYLYDRIQNRITAIDPDPILHATFSPDGSKIAYVKNNNLYIYDIHTAETSAITTDGRWNYIINGNCDWVYEEEFSFTQAYQWSPDGKNLAYYRFDESQVKEFTMTYYDNIYPTQYTFKYPKAGESNSVVSIHVYNINRKNSYQVHVDDNPDIYIPRIMWANAHELLILRLNRLQNNLDYIFHDIKDQKTNVELTDKSSEYVDILDPIVFYNEGRNMLYLSEKSAYIHIYDFNRKTKKDTNLTPYDFDVNKTLGYNTQNKSVYFIASPNDPLNNGIYAVSTVTGKIKTISEEDGWYSVQAFPSVSVFMVTHSNIHQTPHIYLMNEAGKNIQTLENNKELQSRREEYSFGKIEFKTLLADDGETPIHGYLILPHDFDRNKKYPVLMYQYSGPGSQEAKNTYNLGHGLWHHYLTTKGYIVACFDGRGTGNRGETFKKMTYLQLGKYESDDQISIARQLSQEEYVDQTRIGIWGWSYGGFISSICILKGHEVFKTAISVAPVTHWTLYDNIYTERFMRTPQENPQGYNDNAPIFMTQQLKGNFLLIHGTADDNVHFQNAVMLTDALIKSNKQFESFYYPNGNHGIGGGIIRAQLYEKMTNYLLEKL